MHLVEGSAPQLSGETRELLRSRLRIAALLLCAGFLAFLIRRLFVLERYQTTLDWALFVDHVLVTLVTGVLAVMLCRRCDMSLTKLRVAEALIFGCPALFFVVLQLRLVDFWMEHDMLGPLIGPWTVLIFTYALFIPNTWQRAAVVIGILALAPVVISVTCWQYLPAFRDLLARPEYRDYLLETGMMMSIVAGTATVGVHTIRSLRRAAFEARQLGQYRLNRQLGAGGMGEVYLAEHQLLKRPCAIKVIRPEKAGDTRMLARFEREVQATARLTHWNTVEIFDYGRADDGTFYYVMEYLPGLSLAELVERHGPLPPERVIHLLAQTCDGLAEAHADGLLHRDIKPGNIFATRRGTVYDVAKLLDFGLAKPLIETSGGSSELTQDGSITGSPRYMSPEQATGSEDLDERSDIYALGTVAYQLLTGRPPFEDERPLKVMFAHARDPVTPPREWVESIPADLEEIVMRCLAKRPEDRFPDAHALRRALLACHLAGSWTRERAESWWREHGCPQKRALDEAVMAAAG